MTFPHFNSNYSHKSITIQSYHSDSTLIIAPTRLSCLHSYASSCMLLPLLIHLPLTLNFIRLQQPKVASPPPLPKNGRPASVATLFTLRNECNNSNNYVDRVNKGKAEDTRNWIGCCRSARRCCFWIHGGFNKQQVCRMPGCWLLIFAKT